MSYATVMVNLDPGQENTATLQVAGDLSEHFHARVIGRAAGQLVTSTYAIVGGVTRALLDDTACCFLLSH